jgi:protein TonB
MLGMSYQALLFCPDEKTARVVTQVLTELDFTVEPCNETFSAVKKLMAQHFDAIVVDCDNEQNATLLFKSARNSAPNQNSLAVAVVEGQSGVAKAFRIGANLVLTKPINVEQSKGTLRVARGLLRKADATKPATGSVGPQIVAPPVSSDTNRTIPNPSFPERTVTPLPTMTAAQAPGVPEVPTAGFEFEEEEGPKPEAAEAALLESLPDPLAKSGRFSQAPTLSSKGLPWQPVSAPTPIEESVGIEARAKTTGAPEKPAFQPLSFGPPKKSGDTPISSSLTAKTGSAAAAAPAKESVRPENKVIETKFTAQEPGFASVTKDQPIFSAISGSDPEVPSANSNRKPWLYVAAVVLAAAAYFGWAKLNKMQAGITAPQSQSATVAPIPAAAQAPAEEQSTSTETSAAVAPGSASVIAPDTTTHSTAASPAAPKPSGSKVAESGADAVSPVPTPAPVASTPRALVVKSETAQPEPAKPIVAELTQPAAPGALGIAPNSDEKAIAGIISSAPVRVPVASPQHVRISQGVSQGLLAKRVQPVYPSQALQMRVQGSVLLDAKIGKDGSIVSVKRVSGDTVLARAATDAVKQWKYKPYYLNGEPVEIDTEITVNFKLP